MFDMLLVFHKLLLIQDFSIANIRSFKSENIMIAKLEAYGLAKESLELISDYLSYCKRVDRRQKSVLHIVIGPRLFAEFLKALYWDQYFSTLLLITFFLSLKSQTFVISEMITLLITRLIVIDIHR